MKRLALAALLLLAGCYSQFVNVAPQPPKSYAVVGPAKGSACGLLLLDVIPIGVNDRTERAYADAVAKANATALMDTSVTTSWYYAVIGVVHCTEIQGTAIR
jgi:hypothetical protein